MENLTYHAAIYVRLSKEDGDKEESDSIGNQKELISRFLASKPEICIEETFVDDGFSGADFFRPSFQKMLLKLKSGEINCVVVKDLSRFGRNFIETGRFLSTIFPALGVRFIAINDSIDSAGERSAADNQVIIPVRNLINDAYLRDISIKVRSQLEVKRRKGDFIGSFPMYGYLRDPDDRHKLIIDPVASETVLDIFHWKIEGMSQKGIADKLNAGGVLCPAEYKRFICGFRYSSGFQINSKALWSAVTVGRILRNESYIGSLVQGRRTTPNHKVKKVIEKPREDWAIVENHHPAIIDRDDFDVVTRLMLQDTRVAPNEDAVYVFSGLVFCADCNYNMVRSGVKVNGKSYDYYLCGQNRSNNSCTSHRIAVDALEKAVMMDLKQHIDCILEMEKLLEKIDNMPLHQNEIQKVDSLLVQKRDEISRYERLKVSLFESMSDGLIEKNEFLDLKNMYDKRQNSAAADEKRLLAELDNLTQSGKGNLAWVERFKEFRDTKELSRSWVIRLIERIVVYEGNRISVHFKHDYDYQRAMNLVTDISDSPGTASIVASVGEVM